MQATFSMTDIAVELLRERVAGSVLVPGDSRYEQTRHGWNLTLDQHPAVIVVANNAADVVAGVQFARDNNLGVLVQSTGHGIMRPANDNMVIVTSRMATVSVDAEARTAKVGAGTIWKQVLNVAGEYGLAPLLGSSSGVGVVGYTLGGGMGWLARKYGLSADNVQSIEVVTPDGVLRHASASENAELFWGLRGGGGNFGVVTSIEINLFPVTEIYGGMLVYPAELAAESLRFFRSWVNTLPDEMTSSHSIMKFPDAPFIPEDVRGKTMIMIKSAYVGDPAEGEALMQAWLDWQAPLLNTFHMMPFAEIDTISDDPVDPLPNSGFNELVDDLSDDLIEVIVRYGTIQTGPLLFTEIRHGQGAIMRANGEINAIGNREAKFYLHGVGITPNPEAYDYFQRFIQDYRYELKPYLHGGIYLNFMYGNEVHMRTRDAYTAETFHRLQVLKTYYDPQNLFRYSFSIPAFEE